MTHSYVPVIGIEIHVELDTKSKMFCACPADHFGKSPNTQTCPVCLGLPGALPVPNKKAIDWTMHIAHALKCQVHTHSKFDRKHYFYPDLPKGYQISQYDQPLAENGKVQIEYNTKPHDIHITRVHLEEDTGKLKHQTLKDKKVSLVDFNRSGVPLVEIVSEPDISSADQAVSYAKYIQKIIRFLKVSDADMEKGSMRLEANISLRAKDSEELPDYKVEVKNINSFRYLKASIEYEIQRHSKILEKAQTPNQETRGWNERKSATISQRSKETSKDYRYFPEPDIPPLQFSIKQINKIVEGMPKLPVEYQQQFSKLGIREDYVETLTNTPELANWAADIFTLGKKQKVDMKKLANFVVNQNMSPSTHDPKKAMQEFQNQNTKSDISAEQMQTWIDHVITEHPDLVEKYKSGKKSVIGALIGQIMQISQGKADPKLLRTQLSKELDNKSK